MNRISSRLVVVLIAACLGAVGLGAAAESPALLAQDNWHNFFGGQESTLRVAVAVQPDYSGRLLWSLAVDGRLIARREVSVTGPGLIALPLEFPAVRTGIILPARITLALDPPPKDRLPALTHPLWIFAPDPFALEHEALKRLNLRLFDPGGTTADIFTGAEIPYQLLRGVDAVAAATGVVVIAEGLDWQSQRGLDQAVQSAVLKGARILCLAPAGGRLPNPLGDEMIPAPTRMALDHAGIIRLLDKRLDHESWPPDGLVVISTFNWKSQRDRLTLCVGNASGDWSWLDVQYEAPGGRLMLCGFGIIAKWTESPAPRYLLRRILQRLNSTEDAHEK